MSNTVVGATISIMMLPIKFAIMFTFFIAGWFFEIAYTGWVAGRKISEANL